MRLVMFLPLLAAACVYSSPSRLSFGGSEGVRVLLLDQSGLPLCARPIKIVSDQRPGRSAREAERAELNGRTDGAGHFELGYPQSWEGCSWSVWADLGDGWRLADVFCEPPAAALARGGDSGGFQVKVGSRDFEFRFQVHDEAGRPVAGALVHLVAGEESAPIGHLPPRRTNAAGELNWQPFTYGAWQVDISSPGYAPVRTSPYQFLHTDAPGRRYRVQLRAGREVVVEVLGEDSARAAGAEVEFAYANLNLPTFSRWAVKADAQGRAVITVPRGEGAVVSARLPGLEAEVVTSDDTDRVTLRLRAVDARQR